jgi:Ca2+-binding EF-hand superfamily protein
MKNLVKIVKLSLAVAGVLSVISTSSLADDMSDKSKEEWEGKRILPFIAYDKDQDRYVSKSEFYRANAERRSEKDIQKMPLMHLDGGPDFYGYDTDMDNQLNETEFLHSCNHCHESR